MELCLFSDASSSFSNAIPNLIAASKDIYDAVSNTSRTQQARVGVAAFVDYPVGGHGDTGDYPYKLYSSMNETFQAWDDGVRSIAVLGGSGWEESQYDAIVGAAIGLNNSFVQEPDCGWSDDSNFERILLVSTDAGFHLPGAEKPHQYDKTSTLEILYQERIRVVGLEAEAGLSELDYLANATGGVVESLKRDGSDIANSILAGLDHLPCRVFAEAIGCDPVTVIFDPPSQVVQPGGSLTVRATFSTDDDSLASTIIVCQVLFTANREVMESVRVKVIIAGEPDIG